MATLALLPLLPVALAGKLFILWLLGVPAGILIVIFIVAKIFM